MSDPPEGKKLSFEEFKLFYDSTEKVTDRRLATNRWNYSICLGIFIAIAAIAQWGLSAPLNFIVGVVAIVLLSMLAILFCFFWILQIQDFKSLNNAKFTVLSQMAPHVEFDPEHPDKLVSYRPFDEEWKIMQDLDALRKAGSTNLIALKSSNFEYYIPKAFILLYTIVLVGVLVIVVAISINGLPSTKTPDAKPDATKQTTP